MPEAPVPVSRPVAVREPEAARSTVESIELTALPDEIDPLALLEIKLLMQESTQQYLGLLGADLKKQIAAIRDAAALRAIMARWHMALRESRKGSELADGLLDKARGLARWAD
jgi:hypothetical protein